MSSPDLDRLRFFLAGLREPAPSRESERQAIEAFGRLWRATDRRSRWQRTGQDRRTLSFLHYCLEPGGHLPLDSPNDASLFRLLLRALDRRRRLLAHLGVKPTVERLLRLVYSPGRFYYYSPPTYSRLLAANGLEVVEVELRQPRHLLYGNGSLGLPLSAAARVLSIAERLLRRQIWVQIAAVKVCTS